MTNPLRFPFDPSQAFFWPGANYTGRPRRWFIPAALAALLATGCATSIQPWERGDLAATPMTVGDANSQRPERNIEVYREGAVGANGGKSGGGCGCT